MVSYTPLRFCSIMSRLLLGIRRAPILSAALKLKERVDEALYCLESGSKHAWEAASLRGHKVGRNASRLAITHVMMLRYI